MLRRALDLVKKIYEKRGTILYIPSSFAAQPDVVGWASRAPHTSKTTNSNEIKNHAGRSQVLVDYLQGSVQQNTNLALDGGVKLETSTQAAYAGAGQKRALKNKPKVLAELSRG